MIVTIPVVLFIIGIVFGVINNEIRSSTFWFWCALITAVLVGPMTQLIVR